MHAVTLKLMSALAAEALTLDEAADDLAKGASILGSHPAADAMRGMARRHRIEVLRLHGQLAAMTAQYAERSSPT